ncbi:MAG: biotin--[acetyl-CoA-carboxylase] ligase [Armatimonadota bacterium]|nr:biotin--[acetyl-CoA-carboxylase] ligase [Armatimonadota bacterium]
MPGRRLIGSKILHYDSVTSTNDIARELISRQADEGTVVIAAEQTMGRGRRGRKWISPPGVNLLVSIILRPQVETIRLPELAFVVAIAVARYLIDELRLPAKVKWPNDVRVNGKKIAGVLIETIPGVDKNAPWAIAGIGLNINWADLPSEIAGLATSVLLETGRETDIESALSGILDSFDAAYRDYCCKGLSEILEQCGFNIQRSNTTNDRHL